MAIKDISAPWKADLELGKGRERFYVDFRKRVYPPLSTGADPAAHRLEWWKVRKDGLNSAGNMPGSHHASVFKAAPNLCGDPEDMTTWTAVNAVPTLSDYYVDGKRFTKILATAANGYVAKPIAFTGDGVKAIQCELRRGDDVATDVVLHDATAAVDRLSVRVIWATKVLTETTGLVHVYEWRDDDSLLLMMLTTPVTAASTNSLRLTILTNAKFSHFTAAQAEDSAYPTPYVSGARLAARPDYVLPMPNNERFTLRLTTRPLFVFDTSVSHCFLAWYINATHSFELYYDSTIDKIVVSWQDGGTVRHLVSQQFDDGSLHININQWLIIDVAVDLTTGSDAGSELWINRVSHNATWSGNIDAKTSEFALLSVGHQAGSVQADSLFSQILLIPEYVATDAGVQSDYKNVKHEQIVWHFNGEGCGRTRCDITRHVIKFANRKSIKDPVSGQQGANTLNLQLHNICGVFSDDQYATFDPTIDNFNGSVLEKYLQKRCRVEAETWHSACFELFFTGILDENRFHRRSPVGSLPSTDIDAEDMISIIGRKFKRATTTFEDFKLSDPRAEDASLIHAIIRLATKEDIYNFASNSSFENATISNSWAISGGVLTREAGGLFGNFCGQLVNATGGVQSVIQTVIYADIKKLNVGEVWTFFIWLRSAAAIGGANAWLQIMEYDGAAYRASTATSYALIGGEDFVMFAVTHIIADPTSDRLKILIGVPDTKTVQFDGAALIQGVEPINYFVLNNNDGVVGEEDADDADSAGYDTVGFDVDYVNIVHPWAIVPYDDVVWKHAKELGNACGNMYLGLDECGALKLRAKLAAGYQDPTPLGTILSVHSVDTAIEVEQANKIVGHAILIKKLDNVVAMWIASAAGNFDRTDGAAERIKEIVANGAYWPDATKFPEYWAKYGTVGI